METKNCQNCKSDFLIESEDFDFYKKIDVPPPTFCPECRLQRRLSYFNLVKLYRRACDKKGCAKRILSVYHPESGYLAYCPDCWWSDDWDPREYGSDYDFARPFFEQLHDLWKSVPQLGLVTRHASNQNSDYNNYASSLKDCYLAFMSHEVETAVCCNNMRQTKQAFDCQNIVESDRVFDSLHVLRGYNCFGDYNTLECIDTYFCRDCINCQNCFGSTNLKNKKYCFFNEQLTKEEYQTRIESLDLGSWSGYQMAKTAAHEFWKTQAPRPTYAMFSENCVGNYIFDSNNCQQCFDVGGAENCKYLHMILNQPISNSYDITSWGDNQDLCYENVVIGSGASNFKFCADGGYSSSDCEYTRTVSRSSNNCFGSTSMRNASYCILNKQYSKEEYFALKEKIIEHMNEMPYVDKQGNEYRYGEFFPVELSPFEYKYTLAQNFFPLTDEEILERGYTHYPEIENEYQITLEAKDLPDHIKDAPDEILNEVIACLKTGKAYKIHPMELEFLRRMHLPLPRLAPIERINEKINIWTKEMKLTERVSSLSGEAFLTHHTEQEAPIIYTPGEYQQEFLS